MNDVSSPGESLALTDVEISAVADALMSPGSRTMLAVSGGVDSMTMLHVAGRHLMAKGRSASPAGDAAPFVVATVDHGLRPGSAPDVDFVKAAAARYGLPHVAATWTGPKPQTAIQATAREARYRLLAAAMEETGCVVLALAHTADDQAETVLMRLARGSGVDGLSAMAPRCSVRLPGATRDCVLRRPLLEVPKARLVATMTAWGEAWREDPSNENDSFERVRVRRAMSMLADVGILPEAICRSAARLRGVRHLLDDLTDQAIARFVVIQPLGFVEIAYRFVECEPGIGDTGSSLDHEPGVVRQRVLATAIQLVRGALEPVSLAAIERLTEAMASARGGSTDQWRCIATLSGTEILQRGDRIAVVREPGRMAVEPVLLVPGRGMSFDGRFKVQLAADALRPLTIRPLGLDGRAQLVERAVPVTDVPLQALITSPAGFDDGVLVSAPAVAAFGLERIRQEATRTEGTLLKNKTLWRRRAFEDLIGPLSASFAGYSAHDTAPIDD